MYYKKLFEKNSFQVFIRSKLYKWERGLFKSHNLIMEMKQKFKYIWKKLNISLLQKGRSHHYYESNFKKETICSDGDWSRKQRALGLIPVLLDQIESLKETMYSKKWKWRELIMILQYWKIYTRRFVLIAMKI